MNSISPRQRVLNEALVVISKAARVRGAVYAGSEAKRIHHDHPGCGMSETEIVEVLVQMAVDEKLAVDTMR